MAEETREDPGGTVDATTKEEDTAKENTETWATEAASTATDIRTTKEPERTAQMTETQEAGGLPGAPNYSNQDASRSRNSSVEPGVRTNGALEQDR